MLRDGDVLTYLQSLSGFESRISLKTQTQKHQKLKPEIMIELHIWNTLW